MSSAVKAVLPEEETGCGLACVAMLAGEPSGTVRETAAGLGIFAADEALWADTSHVRWLLAHYGIKSAPQETPFTDWANLPDRALLPTKPHYENGRSLWHWAVFTREPDGPVVLDPAPHLASNRRTDWAAMEVAWLIGVEAAPDQTGGCMATGKWPER